jgi:hypothetical protein
MRKCQIGNEGLIVDLGVFHGWVEIRGVKRIKAHHFWAARYESRPVPAGWHSNPEDVPGNRARRAVSEKLKVKSEKPMAVSLF